MFAYLTNTIIIQNPQSDVKLNNAYVFSYFNQNIISTVYKQSLVTWEHFIWRLSWEMMPI